MNGTIIRIVPGSPDCINVMEIRKIDHTSSELLDGPMPEQSELAAKIQKLHIFFSLADSRFEQRGAPAIG